MAQKNDFDSNVQKKEYYEENAKTPAMKQFFEIKKDYPEHIVLFRMGDFYETFYDDAKKTSDILGITLTKRGGKAKIPLAGIPYHALEQYIPKFIDLNEKVVIVEQLEDPKYAKGVVKRGVIKEITPGTIDNPKFIDEKEPSYICGLYFRNNNYYVSFADITTGEFVVFKEEIKTINDILSKFNPKEIIISKNDYIDNISFIENINKKFSISTIDDRFYDINFANNVFNENLQEYIKVNNFTKEELIVCGALFSYLRKTQRSDMPQIKQISKYKENDYLFIDRFSQRNLEIFKNLYDYSRKNTLVDTLDETCTPMGSRFLKKVLINPFIKKEQINNRLNKVEFFFKNQVLNQEVRTILKEINDIERTYNKLFSQKITPLELSSLKYSIESIQELFLKFEKQKEIQDSIYSKQEIIKIKNHIYQLGLIYKIIDESLIDEPNNNFETRNIKKNYSKELEEVLEISENANKWIRNFEKKERENSKIPNLKVKYNKIFGFYIEISNSHLSKIPENYIRKQTLVNAERFITNELKEKENIILNSKERVIELQKRVFEEIINKIISKSDCIKDIIKLISEIDLENNFAYIAKKRNYIKPTISENYFNIKNGRHPIVELNVKDFVSNSIEMKNDDMIILTGPNMAGKSTYMRQNALIIIMAHLGSYVPASEAIIPCFDKIFVRIGARDDISSGKSTFLVEMEETKYIIDNATKKSFIAIDELGRGTSTFDGISIAWSVAEEICDKIKAKTIFATHYHYLNQLSVTHKNIHNKKVLVKEMDDEVVFIHKVVNGGADKSYGIEVARIAGLNKDIIKKAKEVQQTLEKDANIKLINKLLKNKEENSQLTLKDIFN